MAIIDVHNLDFSYNGEDVLRNVNLSIEEKDFVGIIGPNGGGKTTLLKLLLGLLVATKGTIRIDGKPPQEASPCIGYVPQNVHINPNFPVTVLDVVLMGKIDTQRGARRQSQKNQRDALEALDRIGMADHANVKIGMLSGGQRQRVFIARALATQPKLLLLDEPTASIDTKGQTDLYELLREFNQDITVLVVSHDLLIVSRYVKSMVCVNKTLHYHDQDEIAGSMLETMYSCTVEQLCPVDVLTQNRCQRAIET